MTPSCPPSFSSRTPPRGFALLIVITLLAFLVLLLVSLASLTRVETMVSSNSQTQAQARQNAVMALNIALGQLQKFAGPDNVATARADILATTPANASTFGAYYTGVWGPTAPIPTTDPAGNNVRPSSPLMTWLVSGNEIDPLSRTPADAASPDDVFLVDKAVNGQAALRVRVRKQPVRSAVVPGLGGASTTVGNYAYWVADEGVKAKLSRTDPYARWTPSTTGGPATPGHVPDAATDTRYRLLAAQRFGIENVGKNLEGTNPLGATYDVADGVSADFRRDLEKLSDYRQVGFLPGFSALTGNDDVRAHRFHDLTVVSHGLLTNADTGGLREDLTWHFEQGAASPLTGKIDVRHPNTPAAFTTLHSWQLLRDFYRLADAPRPLEVKAPRQNTVQTDVNAVEVVTPVPVIAQFRLFFSPQPDGRILMRPAFVVGNSYNTDLRLPDGFCFTFGRALRNIGSDITVSTEQVPPGGAPTAPLNILDQLVSGGASATTTTSVPYVYAVSGPVTLPAGEAKVFSAAGTVNFPLAPGATIALAEALNTANGILLTGTWPLSDPAKVEFRPGALAPSRFHLKMWVGQTPSGYPMQHITDQAWAANGTTGPAGGGIQVQFHAPADTTPGNNRSSQVFSMRSLRSPVHLSESGNGVPLGSSTYWSSYWGNDEFATDLALGMVHWGNSNSLATGKPKVILYDVPSRGASKEPALMSLAELRHAVLGNYSQNQAAAIGNSKAFVTGNLNSGGVTDIGFLYNEALWDRFYFSTVPQQAGDFTPQTDLLPNARYVLHSSTPPSSVTQAALTADAYAASRHLMIDGPFNVNSTSIEAWKAFFAGTKGLSLHSEGGNVSYFRTLRQPGQNTQARDLTSDDAWDGYVSLTDAEITTLATRMVAEVKDRGPFNTLGGFVNRRFRRSPSDSTSEANGALQDAIDKAGINQLPGGVPNSIVYTGIPGFLTQGDILQAHGPIVTTRSDTFIIRAYGDCINPLDNAAPPTGRAYCEAVVQRMQDPVATSGSAPAVSGGTPPDYIQPPGGLGRRFAIVSFRWLAPDDL